MAKIRGDKIRTIMSKAYYGDVYHRGIICSDDHHVYFLDSLGNINQCDIKDYHAGCYNWSEAASYTSVIRALSGHKVAMDCTGTAMESLFHSGGTKMPWDIYIDKYGAPPIVY